MTTPQDGGVPPPLTAELARFAAELQLDDIPSEVVEHAKLCLLDTLGCGLFGSTLPWARIVAELAQTQHVGGSVGLWGTSASSSQTNAALVNGTAVHAFELDDLHPRSIVHPGSVVLPAALATAVTGRHSGRDLLVALVAGYEVSARIGLSMGAAHLVQGWHPTGTHGTFGAATAAGKLLGLSAGQMTHALGTAGSMSSGLMAAQFSSMTKRLHAGHAAQSGLTAALLAERGFTGTPDLLENEYGGYLSTFSPTSYPGLVLEGLGERWETRLVGFKPYSTNGSCHPTIDALLEIISSTDLQASDVARVTIHCSTATYKHVGWRYRPVSVTTAQMNLPYVVAVVLTDGAAFVDQFSEERIRDPRLVELANRVDVIADARIDEGGDATRHATRITVECWDGLRFEDERRSAKGSASQPLTPAEVQDKYVRLASKVIGPAAVDRLAACIARLHTVDDLAELRELLVV